MSTDNPNFKTTDKSIVREAYIPPGTTYLHEQSDSAGKKHYTISTMPRVTMNNETHGNSFLNAGDKASGNPNHFVNISLDKAKSGPNAGKSEADRFAEATGLKDRFADLTNKKKIGERFKGVEKNQPSTPPVERINEATGQPYPASKAYSKTIPINDLDNAAFLSKNPMFTIDKKSNKFIAPDKNLNSSPNFDAAAHEVKLNAYKDAKAAAKDAKETPVQSNGGNSKANDKSLEDSMEM